MSVLINTCVVCVFAAGYYGRGVVAADDIGLENAGQYLGRTFGGGIVVIWVGAACDTPHALSPGAA